MTGKPAPIPTEESAPYWASAAKEVLIYQECRDCLAPQFPPGIICRQCGSGHLRWRTSSGRGRIYSMTTVHRAPTPAFAADAPYVLAIIKLEEGFRMMANVVDCDPRAPRIGSKVEVVFEARGEDTLLPQFRLA